MARYFKRLKSSNDSKYFEDPPQHLREASAAVLAFVINSYCLVDSDGETFFTHKANGSNSIHSCLSACIDWDQEVHAGDYGILTPGREAEFSFHTHANLCRTNPNMSISKASSELYNYLDGKRAAEVQASPRV